MSHSSRRVTDKQGTVERTPEFEVALRESEPADTQCRSSGIQRPGAGDLWFYKAKSGKGREGTGLWIDRNPVVSEDKERRETLDESRCRRRGVAAVVG